jgi:hypothetical protein
MKGGYLDKYQTRGESRDEGHHGGRYRDSERQHPILSARALPNGTSSEAGNQIEPQRQGPSVRVCRR